MQRDRATSIVAVVAILLVLSGGSVRAKTFGPWSAPVNAESIAGTSSDFNTPFTDGCPILAPDGLTLYMASNRPGGFGGLDIWAAHRDEVGDPWRSPSNLGADINTSADEFCPSPTRGRRLFFVSTRAGGCGGADIYRTRRDEDAWRAPVNLGCDINGPGGEASPSYFRDDAGREVLYFSSVRPGGFAPDVGVVDSDIYASFDWGPAQLVPGLNTAAEDTRPNVRHDGREVVFDSTRPGTLGGPDIWTATRPTEGSGWNAPIHLDAPVNSAASDTRASLSWDGTTMVFGSTRPGSELAPDGVTVSSDIYVTSR
jgi:hypothetical protein